MMAQMRDLKGKISELIKATSEVSNYLTIKMQDVSTLSDAISEIGTATEKMKSEHTQFQTLRDAAKRQYDQERIDFESWKKSENEKIAELKRQAENDKVDAGSILQDAKKKLSAFESEKDAFDVKRRELEAKHAKISELVG